MKLSDIKTLLQNRLSSLESQRQVFTEVGNIDWVISMDSEIEETKITLNEING